MRLPLIIAAAAAVVARCTLSLYARETCIYFGVSVSRFFVSVCETVRTNDDSDQKS